MLERLVLKNAADCTSQRLKRTSGAQVMTVGQNYIFSSYLSLGSMLERLVLKNAEDCTSQRLKRTFGVRVMNFVVFTSYWKQTSRQADKQTCRQADKQTSSHADKHIWTCCCCWLLVVGWCWLLLVVGCCWLLVVGCWSLVVGGWLSVGLELSLTDVCRTWAIFDRRLSDLSYLWPTSVGLELFVGITLLILQTINAVTVIVL